MSIEIKISVPPISEILASGEVVKPSPNGNSWSATKLGNDAKKKGVYVIHHAGIVRYVGKTDGEKMTFGMRLRRHFQENAAGLHTYPKLCKLDESVEIFVYMIPIEKIRNYVLANISIANDLWQIPIFESALIAAYDPEFQRK